MTAIVVGVDGGGTKTRVVVADERGQELGALDAPPSAVRPGDEARSAAVIADAVTAALASIGMSHVRPRALCAGVAGTGREPEREALWRALVECDVADETVVHTDAAIALDDAFSESSGILLIAGTGSIAWGRGPTGRTARAGGWGPVIGDEGGGAWIGRHALGIVAAATDGREPDTALVGAVLTACDVDEVAGLVASDLGN